MNKLLLVCIMFLWVGYASGQIGKVTSLTSQPRQYERIDIDIELTAKWNNPFLQEEVALDMLITTPSGKELLLPCYYESGESGKSSLWKARFAPQETGTYSYRFQLIRNGRSKTNSKPQTFQVTPSGKPGFLHTKNDWILEFDNGTPFRGIGENICWESRDNDDSKYFKQLHEMGDIFNYEYMLPNFARNGGNFFRTWICSWNLPIDYKGNFNNSRYIPSDEFYNPSAVAAMDRMIDLSESLNLYIMLTLGQGGSMGREAHGEQFFINPEAKKKYKNRLRYLVARWGYSPAIAMWEFFNEVDNVQYRDKDNPIKGEYIVQWHTEMSAYLKQIDPYKHIVTTSISHRDIDGLNSIPDIDINQKHIYNNTGILPEEIRKYTKEFNKPYIIGEFGYEWDWSKNFDDFAEGMDMDFKRGLWYGIFSPTPVTPMSWWWEYFDNRWMTNYFRGVQVINDRMLAAGNGSFEIVEVKTGECDAFGLKCGEEIYVYLFNPNSKVMISDLTVQTGSNKSYEVYAYEPTLISHQIVSKVQTGSSSVTLPEIALGARKEIIYILTPTRQF